MEYIFVTGMGRSGTKLLAALFSHIQGVNAVHECIGNREYWLLSWYMNGDDYAVPYLQKEKLRIENRFKNGIFIDVNGYLQNSVPQLHHIFRPKKIFHFVRNPKSVVRSLYTRRNDADIHLVPKTKDEIVKWLEGDKFYQVCWNWASTTSILLNQNTDLLHSEKIVSDYGYFKEKMLEPLNLQLPEEIWQKVTSVRVNKTRSGIYRRVYSLIKGKPFIQDELPVYEEWTQGQKNTFAQICGPVMTRCGYSL